MITIENSYWSWNSLNSRKQSRPSTLTFKARLISPLTLPPYPSFYLRSIYYSLFVFIYFIPFFFFVEYFHCRFSFIRSLAVLFFLTLFRLKNTLTSWSERLRHYLELSIHLENMLYETRYNGNETGSGDSLLSDYFSSPHGGDGLRVALDKVMLFFFIILIGHTLLKLH